MRMPDTSTDQCRPYLFVSTSVLIVWAMLHDWKCSFCLQVAMVLAAIVLLAAGAAAQPFQPGTGFAPLGMLLSLLLLAPATICRNWAFTAFTRLYHPLW